MSTNSRIEESKPITRGRLLTLGGGVLVAGAPLAIAAAGSPARAAFSPNTPTMLSRNREQQSHAGDLPVKEIQEILQADGTVNNGVLSVELDRKDLSHVIGPRGIPFKPAFEINSDLHFQSLGGGSALFIGDIVCLPSELNPVINEIVENGLIFMAEHQHYFNLSPMVFFIHFRGVGNAIALARALHNVVRATAQPLPQKMNQHPTTPLHAEDLADIMGATYQIGDEGVVSFIIPRRETIVVGGVATKPDTALAHTVAFEPLDGGKRVAAGPDFALIGPEVNTVMKVMQGQGFEVHCLYNQETDERPQLYFSHMLNVGNEYDMARAIRKGLNRTNSRFQ